MAEYVAGFCHWGRGALEPPFETLNITAAHDDDAVRQAIEWQLAMTVATLLEAATWLQVLRDGTAIYSKEIGQA
jgi:hypothetical protein